MADDMNSGLLNRREFLDCARRRSLLPGRCLLRHLAPAI